MLYHELNLPIPVTDNGLHCLLEEKKSGGFSAPTSRTASNSIEFEQHLNPELKKIFDGLNLKPVVLKVFGHTTIDGKRTVEGNYQTYIHSDVYYRNCDWEPLPFALNWELSDEKPTMKWFDVGNAPLFKPSIYVNTKDIPQVYDRGIHYGKWRNDDVSEYTLIESYAMKKGQCVMLNTQVPHVGEYTVTTDYRATISIRFPVEQISTWEQAEEIFKPYFGTP